MSLKNVGPTPQFLVAVKVEAPPTDPPAKAPADAVFVECPPVATNGASL